MPRRVVIAVLLVFVGLPAAGSTARPATASEAALSAEHTAELLRAVNQRRAYHARDAVFGRASYVHAARGAALRLARGENVTALDVDGAPAIWTGLTSADPQHAVRVAIREVVDRLDGFLRDDVYTDAGWAVATQPSRSGTRIGVALVAGWPAPRTTSTQGCGAGYCWSSRGVNPHLPWTRNQLGVFVSSAGLPSDGEAIVRAGIARLNQAPGLGADLVYGGRTADRADSRAHRFVVAFTGGCPTRRALACTDLRVHGHDQVHGALVRVMRSRYLDRPDRELWIGTVAHELAHALGLGHYDKWVDGRRQLMYSGVGANTVQSGDATGLRRMAPPGRLSVTLRIVGRTLATMQATVAVGADGLGGVRLVWVECTDVYGRWQSVAGVTGTFDIRYAGYALSWPRGTGLPRSAQCRGRARSKAASAVSPAVAVTLR